MPVLAEVGSIFSQLFSNTIIIALVGIVILVWGWIYLYMMKFNKSVEIHEQSGSGVSTWWTKAGKVWNKSRQREELHILRSKWTAPLALFFSHWRWERPYPDNKYHHKGKKGKTEFKYAKKGDKGTDLFPIAPPDLNNEGDDRLKAVDERIHSWFAQGIERDARETRHSKSKWEKVQAFAPYVVFAMLFLAMIFTYQYGEKVNSMAVTVSENLKEAETTRLQASGQEVPTRTNNTKVDEATRTAQRIGIDLGQGDG